MQELIAEATSTKHFSIKTCKPLLTLNVEPAKVSVPVNLAVPSSVMVIAAPPEVYSPFGKPWS